MSGEPLIEIRDDMGNDAEVVANGNAYKLVAGPQARLGALHQVINDLATYRAECRSNRLADQAAPDGQPMCRMIRRTIALGYVPAPRFECQRQPAEPDDPDSTEPDCAC